MNLIVITGFKGSGKSEVAKRLIRIGYTRVSFADPLKSMLKGIGLTDAHLYGSLKEVPTKLLCGQTPRHAMQTLGTEWGRELIGKYIWIGLWEEAVKEILRSKGKVVTDDLRFPDEGLAVVGLGGHIWRVHREATSIDNHTSETSIDNIEPHWHLFNTGTLEDLSEEVNRLIELRP